MRLSRIWRIMQIEEAVISAEVDNTLRDLYNCFYYSFKIFLRFWLAKSTRIIHLTSYCWPNLEELCDLSTDDVKSAVQLQVNAQLTQRAWVRGWVVLVVKRKMAEQSAEHFTRFSWNCCLKHSKKTTRRTTSAIWSIHADLNSPLSSKHALSRWTS